MELALALVFGLVIGSFLNVCIARLPHGNSISFPRSHCPHCKTQIAFYDNVPVLSYIVLGGKCRSCRKTISVRYPIVEGANGLVSVLLYLKFGLSLAWGIYCIFCSALVVLALIDAEHRILPDSITLNGIWVGILAGVIFPQPSAFVTRMLGWFGWDVSDPRVTAVISSLFGIIVGGGLLWLV